ncbi:hypothetical protein NAAC61_02620 [Petrotoga sp. 8T1HF07.NaAc.6.1]|nr:hypothetical protein [Petrotoga sp. 8T1HF07.NaAc.6.1]
MTPFLLCRLNSTKSSYIKIFKVIQKIRKKIKFFKKNPKTRKNILFFSRDIKYSKVFSQEKQKGDIINKRMNIASKKFFFFSARRLI